MVVRIGGKRIYLWGAVDDEGEVLDMLVQKHRHRQAATKPLCKLLGNCGIRRETITTDKLASYRAALRDSGMASRHRPSGMRENNGAENSHLATHAAIYNTFYIQPHLVSRCTLRIARA